MTTASGTPLGPPLRVAAPGGEVAVYPHGAHVVAWRPAGGHPVLWTSALARYDSATAIRGGVPLVFPWFGSGRSGDLRPAHGYARLSEWTVLDVGLDGDDAVVHLGLDHAPFRLRYEVRAGRSLALRLTVENVGKAEASFEEALHTYLAVGDVRRVRVEGLDGCRYLDQVGEPAMRVQEGDVTFVGETDRVYASGGSVRVVDPTLGRVLVVRLANAASTVVWNPWVDKARAMADFGDDEWPGMLCIEGGNVKDAAVVLAAGESHTLAYDLSVET